MDCNSRCSPYLGHKCEFLPQSQSQSQSQRLLQRWRMQRQHRA